MALGVRTDVETAGSIFGLSRTQAYEAVNAGRFPVPTFRIGRRVVVPVAPILVLLRLDAPTAGPISPIVADDQANSEEADTGEPVRVRALRG